MDGYQSHIRRPSTSFGRYRSGFHRKLIQRIDREGKVRIHAKRNFVFAKQSRNEHTQACLKIDSQLAVDELSLDFRSFV